MHGPPLLSHWRAEHGHEASCSDHDDRAACHASYTDYPVAPEGAPEGKMEAMLNNRKDFFSEKHVLLHERLLFASDSKFRYSTSTRNFGARGVYVALPETASVGERDAEGPFWKVRAYPGPPQG